MKFGTSGLRGLVTDLLGAGTARYAAAFGRYLLSSNQVEPGAKIYVGGDLRPSTPEIIATCIAALEEIGLTPINCGFLPTPALALHAMTNHSACLMVTGSHIPADRNGIKFYTPSGEITKLDEQAITALVDEMHADEFRTSPLQHFEVEASADRLFIERNKMLLPNQALADLRIGVYQHSTVARDGLVTVLQFFGADVVVLGRSDDFIPVDTEAVPEALVKLLKHWAELHQLDAIVSADGDGDRPLVADEAGEPVRGDALGLLVARYLSAKVVATPVTSSSGLERSGPYRVTRTKVGSPFVIEAMLQSIRQGHDKVMGFEANGGVLTGSSFEVEGQMLRPLPTRDCFLPILAALYTVAVEKRKLSQVVSSLKLPVAVSDRIQDYSVDRSDALMAHLRAAKDNLDAFLSPIGKVSGMSDVDGLRVSLEKNEIVHIRPSGNAPEMRCYVEATSRQRAENLLAKTMRIVASTRIR